LIDPDGRGQGSWDVSWTNHDFEEILTMRRRIMLKVSGRRLAITSETRARLPMNGARSFRVSPRFSMQGSMAAMGGRMG
jgi:hypothetical protein